MQCIQLNYAAGRDLGYVQSIGPLVSVIYLRVTP